MKQTFHLRDPDRLANLISYAVSLPQDAGWVATFSKEKTSRSLAQNSLWHMWFKYIADHVAEHHGRQLAPKWFKEYFKDLFLGEESQTIKGKVVTIKRGTSDLSVKEGVEFTEKVDFYCADEWGIQLPHPEDLFRQAMGR
jgi:hypothetical protein